MIQKTTFWAAHVAALKLEQGETGDRKQGTDHGLENRGQTPVLLTSGKLKTVVCPLFCGLATKVRKTENRGLSPVLWFGD